MLLHALGGVFAVVACNGSTTEAECRTVDGRAKLSWIQENVFTPSCAYEACHTGVSTLESLQLTVGAAHRMLVDVPSRQEASLAHVKPGNPAKSYLMIKLGDFDQRLLSGKLMPYNRPILSPEIRATITCWIAGGAQPD